MDNLSPETPHDDDPGHDNRSEDAPTVETRPNVELLADLEHDLARVEQSLADLESGDPAGAIDWIPEPTITEEPRD